GQEALSNDGVTAGFDVEDEESIEAGFESECADDGVGGEVSQLGECEQAPLVGELCAVGAMSVKEKPALVQWLLRPRLGDGPTGRKRDLGGDRVGHEDVVDAHRGRAAPGYSWLVGEW